MAINEEEDLMCFSIKKLNTIKYRHTATAELRLFRSSVPALFQPFCLMLWTGVGRGSSVGVATRYGLEGPEIESRWRRDFLHLSRPALGPTQPPIQWVMA